MEILRASHLCKTYGKGENEVRALDDVSFSIEKGEFVAIVGTSGSGKSTLMHILGGVDRPDSGSVYMDGQDIYKQNDEQLAIFRRRQVGLIYQFYNLIPVLDAVENMTLPALLDGRKVEKSRIDQMINDLGLKGREHHLPMSNEKYHQTLIIITHDEEIANQAKHLIRIEDGRICRDEVIR